ncbi:MAG TPA: DUF397 domain-containing protein [Trebonia sp.]|nr:DUF397 domain-containing protein [Trebonia sp.]
MTSDNFTTWRKATYSHGNGDCVEVAGGQSGIGVRDTVERGHGLVLKFPAPAWRAFVCAAKSGDAKHFRDQLA